MGLSSVGAQSPSANGVSGAPYVAAVVGVVIVTVGAAAAAAELGDVRRPPDERADAIAAREQALDEGGPDEPGRAGDEDAHALSRS